MASSSAAAAADLPPEVLTGPQSCLFCGDQDWQSVYRLRQPPPPGPWALPQFIVVCIGCAEAVAAGHREALLEKLEVNFDSDAGAVLALFEDQATTAPIPRS